MQTSYCMYLREQSNLKTECKINIFTKTMNRIHQIY